MVGINIGECYNQIIAVVGILAGVYLTQRYEENRYKLQERKQIRDERKIAYRDLLSIAFQIDADKDKNDPKVSIEFHKKVFDNLAELSLIGSPKVNSKFMEIKSRYQPIDGNDFYKFFAAIIKELPPIMYDEMSYANNERLKDWWQFWK